MSWQAEAEKVLQAYLVPGAKVLIAVSGGSDSVALAHFLRSQPYALCIGHIDHQLRRGSSSDAAFVERLARKWEIPCTLARVNVRRYAKAHHLGIEESARALRYKALGGMAHRMKCKAVITAHTADDQAETVLLHFLRGAGPSGLSGISEARELDAQHDCLLLRPFLSAKKSDLLRYARQHALSYRHDPSNNALRFARNRIRHATLPYLEKHSPGLTARLIQSANVFRQEERYWESRVIREFRKTVRKDGQRFTVVLTKLLGYHEALSRRILRRILPGSSFQDINDVLALARSPQRAIWLNLPGPWRVKRDTNVLVIQKRTG